MTETSGLLKRLLDMRSALLRLHQALILSEQVTYEHINGRVGSPDELLHLVVNDPWFTWLHPFSLLVQRIDELVEDESRLWLVEVAYFLDLVRSLTRLSEEGDGFARSYYEAMVREPDVLFAHMEVRKLLTFFKFTDPRPLATATVGLKKRR